MSAILCKHALALQGAVKLLLLPSLSNMIEIVLMASSSYTLGCEVAGIESLLHGARRVACEQCGAAVDES